MTTMPLPPVTEYYRITFRSNGSAGPFDVAFIVARERGYQGDGSELGNGDVSGLEQLTAIANGIKVALEQTSAPYWGNIEVVSIEAQPTNVEPVRLV